MMERQRHRQTVKRRQQQWQQLSTAESTSACVVLCLLAICLVSLGLLWLLVLPSDGDSTAGDSVSCAVPRLASKQAAIEALVACLLRDQQARFEPFNRSQLVNFTDQPALLTCKNAPPHLRDTLLARYYNSSQLARSWPSVAQFLGFIGNGTFQVDKRLNQSWTAGDRQARLDRYTNYLKRTGAMQGLHATLLNNGLIPASEASIDAFFTGTMHSLWFQFYGRRKSQQARGLTNSCGFEHTFVGEVRGQKVIGFHNWLQLLAQEEAGRLRYRGHYGMQRQPLPVASVCFDWLNRTKAMATLILGTEPEFDLALYTATHLLKANGVTRLTLPGYEDDDNREANYKDEAATRKLGTLDVQNYEADFAPSNVHSAFVVRLNGTRNR